MLTVPYDIGRFHQATQVLSTGAAALAARGFTPATSGNFSLRVDAAHIAITASGRDKGRLTDADILAVDLAGRPVGSTLRPSAETLLHTQLYGHQAEIGCVLHTHSRTQTVASRVFAAAGEVCFQGYEIAKAFSGIHTHDTSLSLPILPNTQDMAHLASRVAGLLAGQARWGYLIEAHGLYVWGRDWADALRHLEAFEFLLSCELEMRRFHP